MIDAWLQKMGEEKASDLFLMTGIPVSIKLNGAVRALETLIQSPSAIEAIVLGLMNESQREEFKLKKEINFSIQWENLGRFRVNAFQHRSYTGAVLRRIETSIPTLVSLNVPPILSELSLLQKGLVLVVGATGVGKSSTLAAMVGHRNQQTQGHIVSIEDPIEFLHPHQGCIVTQREVGIDTESYEMALQNTLRQAPDVILIGEIRSREVMSHALSFAETGHLCLATLHANNTHQAFDRILSFFSADQQKQIGMDLSLNLKAIVAQLLIPHKEGYGRVPAFEVLINTPIISEHIRKGEIDQLKGCIAKSTELQMQTFDQALYQLYAAGKISYESALKYADSENEVRLKIKLMQGGESIKETSGLSMVEEGP